MPGSGKGESQSGKPSQSVLPAAGAMIGLKTGMKFSQRAAYLATVADIVKAIIDAFEKRSPLNLSKLKTQVSQRHGYNGTPKVVDILTAIPDAYKDKLKPFLMLKPVRAASGISVVAVMCKPHRCPHIQFTGNVCVYCPGGPDSDFEYSTQAYTGYEPTSMRAIRSRYDPWEQTRDRVEQLEQLGHTVDKVEFIVMGGTFLSLDKGYKDWFIRNLHDALSGHASSSIEEAVYYSEQSRVKCIGITIETRPDYCLRPHLNDMLSYGCTRIEIGVQSVYEDVARDTNRGHTVAAVCHSFELAKECGYKVVTHMMPDLPNMGFERDIEGFQELFENPAFRPDGLKIYPTLVIRGTGLYELWKTGAYRNYPPEVLVDLVARVLALIPPWVRVYRVQRDIPMPLVTSGVEKGNLRELAHARMRDLGMPCRDVRNREVGMKDIHQRVRPDQVELVRRDYAANGGWETFISYEDPQQDILVGMVRLRRNGAAAFRPEITKAGAPSGDDASRPPRLPEHLNRRRAARLAEGVPAGSHSVLNGITAATPASGAGASPDATALQVDRLDPALPIRCSIVRELHVYGSAVPVHARDPTKFQHQGYGALLMEEAERIAVEEHGSDKLAVISGVGTRHYYRKLGYHLEGPYMVKYLGAMAARACGEAALAEEEEAACEGDDAFAWGLEEASTWA